MRCLATFQQLHDRVAIPGVTVLLRTIVPGGYTEETGQCWVRRVCRDDTRNIAGSSSGGTARLPGTLVMDVGK